MKKLIFVFLAIAIAFSLHAQNSVTAKALVAKMTLDEKVNLVVGMGMVIPGIPEMSIADPNQKKFRVSGAAGSTYSIPRLGIPTTIVADGPAGLRIDSIRKGESKKYFATAWPVASLLASTWDTKLVTQVGKAIGNEVKEYGVDVILGPGMNIHRNPLGGRNFEYYSEDPLVAGKMAASIVNGIQSNGVGTSIKHFAANNEETNRHTVSSNMSERALREIYLKGFEIAVKEAQPWTVMSSYNLLNGTYTSQEYDLLTTILRKEWGFKGMVMSDWSGGDNPVAQMKAGNDLIMPGRLNQRKAIKDAINNGTLDIKVVDKNAERIVNYILHTPTYKKYVYSNKPDLKAHAAIARAAAASGMVLLKNDAAALPISTSAKIAAFGITSYDFVSGGRGSGKVNQKYTVSLVQGLLNAGYKLDESLTNTYKTYVSTEKAKQPKQDIMAEFKHPTPRIDEIKLDNDLITAKAVANDIALISIGRNAGEGADRKVENDFNLKDDELKMITDVSNAFHAVNKKVVVIINSGGVIETASWRDKVDGILLTWQPGMEAGNAVADVLSGKVNPSGKLASTFPVKYDDDPTAKNFPGKEFGDKNLIDDIGMSAVPSVATYEEGIYVGYRYYNTFKVKPAYEFGFGLSYTNFEYSNLTLNTTSFNGKIIATVDVKNTGKVAGKEVVEVYISAPGKELEKPAEELKAFGKTNLLQPGQKQTMQFEISASDIASFDTPSSSWIAEAGTYDVKIGSSSENILQKKSFTVAKDIIVEKCHKVLGPQEPINELTAKNK